VERTTTALREGRHRAVFEASSCLDAWKRLPASEAASWSSAPRPSPVALFARRRAVARRGPQVSVHIQVDAKPASNVAMCLIGMREEQKRGAPRAVRSDVTDAVAARAQSGEAQAHGQAETPGHELTNGHGWIDKRLIDCHRAAEGGPSADEAPQPSRAVHADTTALLHVARALDRAAGRHR
jgi:hypothetical protein